MNNTFDSSSNKYLDTDGLKALLKRVLIKKSGDTQYWNNNSSYIPMKDELIIYTDAKKSINNIGIPIVSAGIKIGNGINSVSDLPFVNNTVEKLEHSLTIGEYVFDGSADVTIPIYKGNLL